MASSSPLRLVVPLTPLERLSRVAVGHHGVTQSEELATREALFTGIAREGVTSSFLICERSEREVSFSNFAKQV